MLLQKMSQKAAEYLWTDGRSPPCFSHHLKRYNLDPEQKYRTSFDKHNDI